MIKIIKRKGRERATKEDRRKSRHALFKAHLLSVDWEELAKKVSKQKYPKPIELIG